MHFDVVWDHWPLLVEGALTTLLYSICGFVIGLAAAIALLVAGLSFGRFISGPTAIFVECVRNTPFLVQAFFLYFGLAALGFRMSALVAALIIVAFNSTAYAVEILRSGLQSVPKGMIEAGDALGMTSWELFRHVIARPALRAAMPALAGQFIIIMLNTSLLSAISIPELTYRASNLASTSFRPFEIYTAIAVIYFAMSTAFALIFAAIYRSLTGSWASIDIARRGVL